uniref:Ig-like domain-containing protein n=1 Tax=Oryzias latipes TaxID=8090 RepID=A0A3P9JT97_ORYLA
TNTGYVPLVLLTTRVPPTSGSDLCLCSSAAGLQNITAEPGQNVTLTCEAPKNLTVLVAEWTRTISDKECLFVVRQNHIMEDVHQQFRNRLFLPEDAKGGGSVVVRNVTFKDSGTYVCQIKQTRSRDKNIRNSLNLISIRLSVVPPGDPSSGEQSLSSCLMSE